MLSLSISVWRRAGKDAILPGKPIRDCSFALQGVTCLITALQSRRRSPFPPANSHHGHFATASKLSAVANRSRSAHHANEKRCAWRSVRNILVFYQNKERPRLFRPTANADESPPTRPPVCVIMFFKPLSSLC